MTKDTEPGVFYVCVEGQEFPEEWNGYLEAAMVKAEDLAKQFPGKEVKTLRLINTAKAETFVRFAEA